MYECPVLVGLFVGAVSCYTFGVFRTLQAFGNAIFVGLDNIVFSPYNKTFVVDFSQSQYTTLTCTYKTEKSAVNNSQKIAQLLKTKSQDIEILGPTPAFYERVRDTYRWQIIVKSPQRRQLINLIKYIPPAHWQYELDPMC